MTTITSLPTFSPTDSSNTQAIDLAATSQAQINERGGSGVNAARTRAAAQRPVLLASGVGTVVITAPVRTINSWATTTLKAVEIRPAPAGGQQTLVPISGSSRFISSPVVTVPAGFTRNNVQTVLFPARSQILRLKDVPTFRGTMSLTKLTAIEDSLTPQLIKEFNNLTPAQKALARTWISAIFAKMNVPANEEGYIHTSELPEAFKQVLRLAKASGNTAPVPAEARVRDSTVKPTIRTTPASKPVPTPTVAATPNAQTPQVAATPEVQTPATAGTPSPQRVTPTAGTTTPAPTSTIAWPFPNEAKPAWFEPAIAYNPDRNSLTYQPDRDMGTKVVKLLVDAREFAAQAATIQVTPALTARWNAWKQA